MKSALQIFFIVFYDFREITVAKGRVSRDGGSWLVYGVFFLNMPYLGVSRVEACCWLVVKLVRSVEGPWTG